MNPKDDFLSSSYKSEGRIFSVFIPCSQIQYVPNIKITIFRQTLSHEADFPQHKISWLNLLINYEEGN